ncbi:uncharacterized protein LOC101849580 isoform X1 [Aplysia californica]|uniref:Uncharacterized protein LOC101849580 isoform X1 n=1 Tax=Aplysia californica TaxID=6500 RepID=A0ABM1ADI7_APLCA|nr:uncharacterized protein LOC101849580 isoform X1 [Aplysia californica]XP_012945619.1 uncharacterized protein LOC101849580 isoform X1 [Aplysia californica]
MGNTESRDSDKPSVLPSVLQAEIASLNQGDSCELEILPIASKDVNEEEFEHFSLDRFSRCPKKSEHDHFIPVCEVGVEHLPVSARCSGILKLIKHVSKITVRLTICYTAEDRPKQFRCGGIKCGSYLRCGTGHVDTEHGSVNEVADYTAGMNFVIRTAAHVVFNDKEAEKTTIDFFYDNDSDRSHVIRAKGVRVLRVNTVRDFCEFLCKVENKHDGAKVMERLSKTETEYYNSSWPSPLNLAICVSHPHGTAQKVSFGTIKSSEEETSDQDTEILKILVHRCSVLKIDVKKVFFFYFSEVIIAAYCLRMLASLRPHRKATLLSHLESKGLILRPTEEEMQLIKREYLQERFRRMAQMEDIFSQRYGSQNISPEYKKALVLEILDEIVCEYASTLSVPDGFLDRYKTTFKEIGSKNVEIMFGKQFQENDSSFVQSLTYSVPTCPGSSGAPVWAIVFCNPGYKLFIMSHSAGGGSLGNRSGAGVCYSF